MKQEIIYKNVNSLKGKTYLYNDGRTIVMHCKHCNKNVKPDALLKINKYNKMLFFLKVKSQKKQCYVIILMSVLKDVVDMNY